MFETVTSTAEPQRLDPDLLEDADGLCESLRAWVQGDVEAARRQTEIDDLAEVVRDRADEQVADLVLELVRQITRRDEALAALIATRAFQDGQRHPLVRGDGRDERDGGDDRDERDGLPLLDPRVLADSDLLGMAIDQVLSADFGLRGLAHVVHQRWDQIRRRVPHRVWRQILRVEELANRRAAVAQEVLVSWAYRAGARRSPGGS